MTKGIIFELGAIIYGLKVGPMGRKATQPSQLGRAAGQKHVI